MCVKNFFDLVKRTSLAMYNSNGFSAVMQKVCFVLLFYWVLLGFTRFTLLT